MDGVLVIDKPAGPTSHDVVARARRALRERRIGHTGTLDPFATGVLPLVVGRATRLARFLSGREKTYDAVLRLGFVTDTYDVTGLVSGGSRVAAPETALPGQAAIEAALAGFLGRQWQVPPAFSAKRVAGVRSHTVARRRRQRQGDAEHPAAHHEDDAAAHAESLAPVEVTVHALSLSGVDGERVSLRLVVSAGFYVRSLAHDLGVHLGCGAHLVALRRTASGDFDEGDAVPLDVVEREGDAASARLIPMERLLPGCPAVRLTEAGLVRVSHGNSVDRPHCSHDGRPDHAVGTWPAVRLLAPDGRLVALSTAEVPGVSAADGVWPLHPAIVLT